ncbi:MAG TPA: type VI secretion system baseplate subunit TssK [Gemmatimonadaceae bacterium]|nr:type VI secretion system baseplate subunit TssK [Gemmatimonadaceae bacterium]
MTQLSRVVWSEGMHLAQHHFQAQARFHEATLGFALSHLYFAPYGLAGCELDTAALKNGTAAIVHARGIMPDGLPFDMPASDPLPAPLDVRAQFSDAADAHRLHLVIPAYRRDRANAADANGNGRNDARPGDPRYLPRRTLVADDATGHDQKEVLLGQKNFRLALEGSLPADAVSLPIARVQRDGSGHFVFDPEYIPPCLQLAASPRLLALVGRLVEILDEKSGAMARGRPGSLDEYARQEIAGFWLLHTIHASLAPLRHHLTVRRTRPESLYLEMARLAGALCTFALDSHPRALPAYDHDDLTRSFDALDRHIRTHLELVMPSGRIAMPLERERAYYFSAEIKDPRCFGPSRWYLGVSARLHPAEIATRVPTWVKLCGWSWLERSVQMALPTAPLTHLPVPPAAVMPRAEWQYFQIDRTSGAWRSIVPESKVGVYIPDAVPDAEVELVVLPEG